MKTSVPQERIDTKVSHRGKLVEGCPTEEKWGIDNCRFRYVRHDKVVLRGEVLPWRTVSRQVEVCQSVY